VTHFRQALEIDPDYEFARFDLGRALIAAGDPAEAIRQLDAVLERAPADADAWSARGSASLLLQDYAAAERAFRAALQLRSRDAGDWYNLGLSLEFQDRSEEAESAYAQALHVDPALHAAAIGLRRVRG
jgi:tetratricopeptide (TPR) repeat protein